MFQMKFALVLALLLLAVAVSNTDAWLIRFRVHRAWRKITSTVHGVAQRVGSTVHGIAQRVGSAVHRVVKTISRPVVVIAEPYVNTVETILAILGITLKQSEQGMCNVNTFMLLKTSSNICFLFKNVNYITTSENTPLLLATFQNFLLKF